MALSAFDPMPTRIAPLGDGARSCRTVAGDVAGREANGEIAFFKGFLDPPTPAL
jgi:hypothetical protein